MLTFQHVRRNFARPSSGAREHSRSALLTACRPTGQLAAGAGCAAASNSPPGRIAHHIAYLLVHSFADWSCFGRSVLKSCAISGTNGSFGFGSVSSDEIERRTLEMVSAGLHWSFRISRQIDPFDEMLQ